MKVQHNGQWNVKSKLTGYLEETCLKPHFQKKKKDPSRIPIKTFRL